MNEVIKEYSLGIPFPFFIRSFFTKAFVANLLLLSIVLSSAFAIVFVKTTSRQLFIEVEQLQADRDKIETEWGRLLLEESALGAQARVQKIAREKLRLDLPQKRRVIMVKV